MATNPLPSLDQVASALPLRGSEDSRDENTHDPEEDGIWVESVTHWTDSYVAHPVRKVKHTDGALLWLWAGVEEGGAGYTVSEDDEYAVELLDPSGELVTGGAFETREAANSALGDLKDQYLAVQGQDGGMDSIEIQGENR